MLKPPLDPRDCAAGYLRVATWEENLVLWTFKLQLVVMEELRYS